MKTVTIYSTPTCGYCRQLKHFLGDRKITFNDHDITSDSASFKDAQKVSNGASSVPIIVFNKDMPNQEVQIGFDVAKVQTALGL